MTAEAVKSDFNRTCREYLKSNNKHDTGPAKTFDRQLFALKLAELQANIAASVPDTIGGPALDYPPAFSELLTELQSKALLELLAGVDRICREVWRLQGEAVTYNFVRDVVIPEVTTLLNTRIAETQSHLAELQSKISRMPNVRHFRRNRIQAIDHLKELIKLKAQMRNRYEIEIRTLEYRSASSVAAVQNPAASNKKLKLTAREMRIWRVIQSGAKGLLYCRALDRAGVNPRRYGSWTDCPRKCQLAAARALGAQDSGRSPRSMQSRTRKLRQRVNL